jgi:hypothetical protein
LAAGLTEALAENMFVSIGNPGSLLFMVALIKIVNFKRATILGAGNVKMAD